jgi:hypothetical protein
MAIDLVGPITATLDLLPPPHTAFSFSFETFASHFEISNSFTTAHLNILVGLLICHKFVS